MENPWKLTVSGDLFNEINQEHSLGKGEVVSSILPGSTTKPTKTSHFQLTARKPVSLSRRTKREVRVSIRGQSVEFVRCAFTHAPALLKYAFWPQ